MADESITHTCQVCDAPGRPCHPELLQQAASALLGVPAPAAGAGAALCVQCSSLAAQACHLYAQLQELDNQLRHFHIKSLYAQLEDKDPDAIYSSKVHSGSESEGGPDEAELNCRLCSEQFDSRSALLRHLRGQHGADTPPGVHYSAGPCEPCTVCRCGQTGSEVPECCSPVISESPAHEDRIEHSEEVATSPEPEVTGDCHSSHPVGDPPGVQQGQVTCTVCPQRFANPLQRKRHQRQAHPTHLSHACRLCAKRFPSPSKLRIHENSHAGARPHACEVCGRRYLSAQKLHIHARSHTGERPFVCHMCGRTFASAAYLAQHELTHTGRRHHQCHVCGKQFTQRGTMMKHVRNVHAGQRAGVCTAQGVTVATDLSGTGVIALHKLGTGPS